VGCDNGLAGIIELVIGFFKALLGIKKSGVKEDVWSDDKSLIGVQLDWDIVLKKGVEGALPEPGYEVSAVDAVNRVLADDVELDVDLGFVKLTLGGLTAMNWKGSSLAPVDVSFPVRYVYKYRQAGMTMARTGLVQAKNSSAVIGKIRLPKGTELDGFVDSGYFYFNTGFDVEVTLPSLWGIEVAYSKAESRVAIGNATRLLIWSVDVLFLCNTTVFALKVVPSVVVVLSAAAKAMTTTSPDRVVERLPTVVCEVPTDTEPVSRNAASVTSKATISA